MVITASNEAVAQLCTEYWKLAKATRRALEGLTGGDRRRLEGQLNFSDRQLSLIVSQLGFRLVEFEGEIYHAGLAATADNAADYSDDVDLIVSKTLEPTVMAEMTIVRLGRVIVEPIDNEGK